MNPADIYLIGHSLGSHISGFTGKTFTSLTGHRVGRITALDPAGPCFSHVDPELRLQSSDAAFVDVIHTDAGVYGLKDSVGEGPTISYLLGIPRPVTFKLPPEESSSFLIAAPLLVKFLCIHLTTLKPCCYKTILVIFICKSYPSTNYWLNTEPKNDLWFCPSWLYTRHADLTDYSIILLDNLLSRNYCHTCTRNNDINKLQHSI